MGPVVLDSVSLSSTNMGSPTKSEDSSRIRFESIMECVDSALASLAYLGNDRDVRILKLRHGLVDGRKRTLEEVGHEFGVTRERIRQLQAKATRRLSRSATHFYSSRIDDCVKELRSFGERVGENLLGKEFVRALSAVTGAEQGIVSAYISLLSLILTDSDAQKQSLREVDLCIVQALAESSESLSIDKLRDIIRSNPEAREAIADWPDLDLPMRLRLVLHVEIDSGGFCTAMEQTLLGLSSTDRRLFALTRVLRESGRPLHFTEIARRARPLLRGKLAMSDRNVHSWMDRYKDHFKWAGPGIYGLTEWDIGVRGGNLEGALRPARRLGVGDEIALLLAEQNGPVSLGYIEDHVLGRFEVNRASVYASITQDTANRFVQLDDGMVGLSDWYRDSQSRATPEPKRRVRLPRELRDTARLAARRKASDVNDLIGRSTATTAPAEAARHAVVAAALGMTHELQMLLDIAEGSNMPTGMSDALKNFSES